MGIHRSTILKQDRMDAAKAKAENRIRKTKERARRDARMVAKIQAGSLPYPPAVMSWLSRKLDIPSSKLTAEDVKKLVS